MSMTTTQIHHLECDICHADGGTTESESPPKRPADWRQVRGIDICSSCIERMSFQEFLVYFDESVRQGREAHEKWQEQERARRARRSPVSVTAY